MSPTDEAEFTRFVRDHWSDLVRAAVFLGSGASEAEEMVQGTLVRCYTKWDRVSAAENREAYVYRMLINHLRDTRRTRWWRSRVEADVEISVDDASTRLAVSDAVHRALNALTIEHRRVVVLRYFAQLSEAQTATVLGIPTGTVKSRLSRALAQLAASTHLTDISEESRS